MALDMSSATRARDSVLVVDPDGLLVTATPAAIHLLRLPPSVVGSSVSDVVRHRRLADLIAGRTGSDDDALVLVDGRLLEVSRAHLDAGAGGVVVLVRDRSRAVELLSEAHAARAFADALNAQHRDHLNRLHLLMGLLELGSFDDALSYLSDVLRVMPGLSSEAYPEGSADPGLSALLVGEANTAAEHGVTLRISGIRSLDELPVDNRSLIAIIGNLVDNAVDAVAGLPDPCVDVEVVTREDEVRLIVADNGPGVPEGSDVFADGFTTKPARGVIHRGLGLALVRHLAGRSGGTVGVRNDGGAVFTVRWPIPAAAQRASW
jgi:two-component system CitB family sensor kinase